MSTDRTPPEEPSLLAKPLGWFTKLVIKFPVPTIAVAVAVALISIGLAAGMLGFRTGRLDLLNPESGYNRLWIEYIDEFGDQDDAVVVVSGENREQVVPVLEELSTALLREDRLFNAVLHEVDLSNIRFKGLHYLPPDELHKITELLNKVEPIVQGDWARLNLGNMVGGICYRLGNQTGQQSIADREAAHLELARLTNSLQSSLTRNDYYESPWQGMSHSISTLSDLGSEYLLTNEGRLGFVLLRLSVEKDSFTHGTEAINALRRLIKQSQMRHPEVQIGLTGLPVMENDEMQASQSAMLRASFLAFVGVSCLFVAGFGGIRHPMITVMALLIAMAWSFGYITLAIGHLNILSISFSVILIGLGIDFGIHYVARYLQLRNQNHRTEDALVQTASGVGPGILTGALTTAIAFFMAGFTEFTGIAELGIITGGGILLCCLAAMAVLPATIKLVDTQQIIRKPPIPLDVHGWMRPLFGRPKTLLIVTLVGTVGLSLGMTQLWYDHNLLNLQADGLESVELERQLLTESDQSVWFALSIAESRDELLARKEQFLQMPSVERVEEIASLFPTDQQHQRPVIAQIQRRLDNLPERPPKIPVDPPADLGRVLARAQAMLGGGPHSSRIGRQLEQIRDTLRRMPLSECYQRLSDYQHRMAGDLLSRLHLLRTIADPEPPKLTDLPKSLVTRFVGQDGRYLLKIYSKGDIWDLEAMRQFVHDVRSVDPRVTGNPLQTYEASREMKASYEKAGVYALISILIILYIDFGKIRYVLLTMVPLGFGILQTFGLMGMLNIPLNPANMIILPLILGIGVDDGVHVIHDFRRQRGRYRMSVSTASAILITSLTTMVGFGSLMIASHQGLQSLGRVLTIGVSCCLFSSLIMLPAILILMSRNRDKGEENDSPDAPTEIVPASPHKPHHLRNRIDHPGTGPHTSPPTQHPRHIDSHGE